MTGMEGRSTYTPDTSLEPCMLRRPDEVSEHHSHQDRSDACLQVDEKSASPSHDQEKIAGIGNSWHAGDVCDDASQKWLALQALSDGSFPNKRRKGSSQSSSLEAAARHLDPSTPTRSSSVTAPAPQYSKPRTRDTQSLPQTLVGMPWPSEEAEKDISAFLSWLSDPSRMCEQWTESAKPPGAGPPRLN